MATHYRQTLVLSDLKGLIGPIDLDTVGVTRIALTRMVRQAQIIGIGRGIDSIPD